MKIKWEKRVLALFFAVVITGGLLTGCGQSNDGETVGDEQSKEPVNLTVACLEGWYSAVSINDNLPVWQEIEKKTGIHINWEANSDYDTAMQPRIAAGKDLPDIMLISPSWGNSGVYKLGKDGIILPLDELIDANAPDIKNTLNNDPDLKALITAPDGVIYSIADTPKLVNDMVVQNALFVREDWLSQVGMKNPVTLNDWHDVLKAFQEKDGNGNGIQDEIPLSGNNLLNALHVFASAFGLPSGSTEWWYDNSGNVFHVYSSPEYREFLKTMNEWYNEGLIDKEINRDEPNFQSLCSTNVVGAFSTLAERQIQYDNILLTAGVSNASHKLLAPPTPSNGELQILKRDATWNHYGITRDCKNPEAAIKWINFVWGSDEGVTYTEFGIEGKTYKVDDNGDKYFTDFVLNNPDGLDPYNALRSLGIANTILVRTPAEAYVQLNKQSDAIPFAESLLQFRVEPFPAVMMDQTEQEIIDRIQPDISTYYEESLTKFITGELPIDQFDKYVDTLKSMGLEEVRQVRQAMYDRAQVN